MTGFRRKRAEGCLSDLALDRLVGDEMNDAERVAAAMHLGECLVCRGRKMAISSMAAEALPALERPASNVVPLFSKMWFVPMVAACVAAAGMLVAFRPVDTTRTKGGESLGFFVKHKDKVRRGAPGETVHPGDQLRFVSSTTEPRFVAVLAVDERQKTSVYYPETEKAAPQPAGRDVPLPVATQLDDVLGAETIIGVFCETPVAVKRLTDLESGPPTGCTVDRFHIVREAPR